MDQKNKEENGIGTNEDSLCQHFFLRLVPSLVKLLRNLTSASRSVDRFVSSSDINFNMFIGNEDTSEEMNDVLD